jgi:hypothetical protein
MVVDPLAREYPHLSPYVYGANNPLRFIDPDGQKLKDIPGQLAGLYAVTGTAAGVIIADDVTGVGIADDVALPFIAAAAGIGTLGVITVNAVDELIYVYQQRTPQTQTPKRTDPQTAEQAKKKFHSMTWKIEWMLCIIWDLLICCLKK